MAASAPEMFTHSLAPVDTASPPYYLSTVREATSRQVGTYSTFPASSLAAKGKGSSASSASNSSNFFTHYPHSGKGGTLSESAAVQFLYAKVCRDVYEAVLTLNNTNNGEAGTDSSASPSANGVTGRGDMIQKSYSHGMEILNKGTSSSGPSSVDDQEGGGGTSTASALEGKTTLAQKLLKMPGFYSCPTTIIAPPPTANDNATAGGGGNKSKNEPNKETAFSCYHLHNRFMKLAETPSTQMRKAEAWESRQSAIKEFLTRERSAAIAAVLSYARQGKWKNRKPDETVGSTGYIPLDEDEYSYVNPTEGLFAHVWHSAVEARRYVSASQVLAQTLFEHRLQPCAAPCVFMIQVRGICFSIATLAPLVGDEIVPSNSASTVLPGVHTFCSTAIAMLTSLLGSRPPPDNQEGLFDGGSAGNAMDLKTAAASAARMDSDTETSDSEEDATLSKLRAARKASQKQQQQQQRGGGGGGSSGGNSAEPGTLWFTRTLRKARLFYGADGRYYFTDPTVFGIDLVDAEVPQKGEIIAVAVSPQEMQTTLRNEALPLVFPSGVASGRDALGNPISVVDKMKKECIPNAFNILVEMAQEIGGAKEGAGAASPSKSGLKVSDVLQQGLVASSMHTAGCNLRFLYLLHSQFVKTYPQGTRGPVQNTLLEVIEAEMLFRTVKRIIRSELYLNWGEDESKVIERVNRLLSYANSANSAVWNQLMVLLREKFNCPQTFAINHSAKLIKIVIWFLTPKMGFSFDAKEQKFSRIFSVAPPSSGFYGIPEPVKLMTTGKGTQVPAFITRSWDWVYSFSPSTSLDLSVANAVHPLGTIQFACEVEQALRVARVCFLDMLSKQAASLETHLQTFDQLLEDISVGEKESVSQRNIVCSILTSIISDVTADTSKLYSQSLPRHNKYLEKFFEPLPESSFSSSSSKTSDEDSFLPVFVQKSKLPEPLRPSIASRRENHLFCAYRLRTVSIIGQSHQGSITLYQENMSRSMKIFFEEHRKWLYAEQIAKLVRDSERKQQQQQAAAASSSGGAKSKGKTEADNSSGEEEDSDAETTTTKKKKKGKGNKKGGGKGKNKKGKGKNKQEKNASAAAATTSAAGNSATSKNSHHPYERSFILRLADLRCNATVCDDALHLVKSLKNSVLTEPQHLEVCCLTLASLFSSPFFASVATRLIPIAEDAYIPHRVIAREFFEQYAGLQAGECALDQECSSFVLQTFQFLYFSALEDLTICRTKDWVPVETYVYSHAEVIVSFLRYLVVFLKHEFLLFPSRQAMATDSTPVPSTAQGAFGVLLDTAKYASSMFPVNILPQSLNIISKAATELEKKKNLLEILYGVTDESDVTECVKSGAFSNALATILSQVLIPNRHWNLITVIYENVVGKPPSGERKQEGISASSAKSLKTAYSVNNPKLEEALKQVEERAASALTIQGYFRAAFGRVQQGQGRDGSGSQEYVEKYFKGKRQKIERRAMLYFLALPAFFMLGTRKIVFEFGVFSLEEKNRESIEKEQVQGWDELLLSAGASMTSFAREKLESEEAGLRHSETVSFYEELTMEIFLEQFFFPLQDMEFQNLMIAFNVSAAIQQVELEEEENRRVEIYLPEIEEIESMQRENIDVCAVNDCTNILLSANIMQALDDLDKDETEHRLELEREELEQLAVDCVTADALFYITANEEALNECMGDKEVVELLADEKKSRAEIVQLVAEEAMGILEEIAEWYLAAELNSLLTKQMKWLSEDCTNVAFFSSGGPTAEGKEKEKILAEDSSSASSSSSSEEPSDSEEESEDEVKEKRRKGGGRKKKKKPKKQKKQKKQKQKKQKPKQESTTTETTTTTMPLVGQTIFSSYRRRVQFEGEEGEGSETQKEDVQQNDPSDHRQGFAEAVLFLLAKEEAEEFENMLEKFSSQQQTLELDSLLAREETQRASLEDKSVTFVRENYFPYVEEWFQIKLIRVEDRIFEKKILAVHQEKMGVAFPESQARFSLQKEEEEVYLNTLLYPFIELQKTSKFLTLLQWSRDKFLPSFETSRRKAITNEAAISTCKTICSYFNQAMFRDVHTQECHERQVLLDEFCATEKAILFGVIYVEPALRTLSQFAFDVATKSIPKEENVARAKIVEGLHVALGDAERLKLQQLEFRKRKKLYESAFCTEFAQDILVKGMNIFPYHLLKDYFRFALCPLLVRKETISRGYLETIAFFKSLRCTILEPQETDARSALGKLETKSRRSIRRLHSIGGEEEIARNGLIEAEEKAREDNGKLFVLLARNMTRPVVNQALVAPSERRLRQAKISLQKQKEREKRNKKKQPPDTINKHGASAAAAGEVSFRESTPQRDDNEEEEGVEAKLTSAMLIGQARVLEDLAVRELRELRNIEDFTFLRLLGNWEKAEASRRAKEEKKRKAEEESSEQKEGNEETDAQQQQQAGEDQEDHPTATATTTATVEETEEEVPMYTVVNPDGKVVNLDMCKVRLVEPATPPAEDEGNNASPFGNRVQSFRRGDGRSEEGAGGSGDEAKKNNEASPAEIALRRKKSRLLRLGKWRNRFTSLQAKEWAERQKIEHHFAYFVSQVRVDIQEWEALLRESIGSKVDHRRSSFLYLYPFLSSLCLPPPSRSAPTKKIDKEAERKKMLLNRFRRMGNLDTFLEDMKTNFAAYRPPPELSQQHNSSSPARSKGRRDPHSGTSSQPQHIAHTVDDVSRGLGEGDKDTVYSASPSNNNGSTKKQKNSNSQLAYLHSSPGSATTPQENVNDDTKEFVEEEEEEVSPQLRRRREREAAEAQRRAILIANMQEQRRVVIECEDMVEEIYAEEMAKFVQLIARFHATMPKPEVESTLGAIIGEGSVLHLKSSPTAKSRKQHSQLLLPPIDESDGKGLLLLSEGDEGDIEVSVLRDVRTLDEVVNTEARLRDKIITRRDVVFLRLCQSAVKATMRLMAAETVRNSFSPRGSVAGKSSLKSPETVGSASKQKSTSSQVVALPPIPPQQQNRSGGSASLIDRSSMSPSGGPHSATNPSSISGANQQEFPFYYNRRAMLLRMSRQIIEDQTKTRRKKMLLDDPSASGLAFVVPSSRVASGAPYPARGGHAFPKSHLSSHSPETSPRLSRRERDKNGALSPSPYRPRSEMDNDTQVRSSYSEGGVATFSSPSRSERHHLSDDEVKGAATTPSPMMYRRSSLSKKLQSLPQQRSRS